MVQNSILKRLDRLESLQKSNNSKIPDIVIISLENGKYRVQETYVKWDARGNVVDGSGVNKILWFDDKSDYQLPDGFKGKCIDVEYLD